MVSSWSSMCPSVICLSIFSLPDDNLIKYHWIFAKIFMCIDIVEIWLMGLQMRKFFFHQFLTQLSAQDMPVFSFPDNSLSTVM